MGEANTAPKGVFDLRIAIIGAGEWLASDSPKIVTDFCRNGRSRHIPGSSKTRLQAD
jgi:hypothetical protein